MHERPVINDQKYTLRLSVELVKAFDAIATHERLTGAEVVRAAMDDYVRQFLPQQG